MKAKPRTQRELLLLIDERLERLEDILKDDVKPQLEDAKETKASVKVMKFALGGVYLAVCGVIAQQVVAAVIN